MVRSMAHDNGSEFKAFQATARILQRKPASRGSPMNDHDKDSDDLSKALEN